MLFGQRPQLLEHPHIAELAQRGNAPPVDAQGAVGQHTLHINLGHNAQAFAGGAGTIGAVEAKGVRLRLVVGQAGGGVHERAAKIARGLLVALLNHQHHPFALLQGGLHALVQALLGVVGRFQAVHHHLDVVHLIAVELHFRLQVFDLAVDAHFQEALLADLLKKLAVVPFACADERRQNVDLLATKAL